jgi:hypothetical protein
MKALLLLFSAALAGCAASQAVPLNDIQTKRVFTIDTGSVYEAVRLFGIREQFHIDSFEEETGRVIGHKTLEARRGDDPKTILMVLRVLKADTGGSEVHARFEYYKHPGGLNKDEEADLAGCYGMLFDIIGQR